MGDPRFDVSADTYADLCMIANRPDGVLSETFPRYINPAPANSGLLTSGRESVFLVPVWPGMVVGRIMFHSATSAAVTPTHQWFSLRNQAGTLLRQTVNDGSTAWASSTAKILALTSNYTFTYMGWARVGIMVAAGTVPTLLGRSVSNAINTNFPPFMAGRDDTNTGLTTTAPATSAAVAAGLTNQAYAQLLPPP